jgi:hypothetical protein
MAATKPPEILLSELLTLHLDLAVKRYKDPDMDKRVPLKIPMPVELAGMRSRLQRAQQQEKDIAKTGAEYDLVMDAIDELHQAHKDHVTGLAAVESNLRATISRMMEPSNGAPSLDGESDGRQSSSDPGEQDAANGAGSGHEEAAGSQGSSGTFPARPPALPSGAA